MRIIYITSSLPYGPGEAFIIPEILELIRQGHSVLIVPMYPRGGIIHGDAQCLRKHTVIQPLLSLKILKAMIAAIWKSPIITIRTLGQLFNSRSGRILLKNLSIYPKSLWLAGLAREWRADHIHAHWAATTASMAMMASEFSGIPWSFTAHRWDIVENNHLVLKVRKASLARFISQSGLKMAIELGVKECEGKVIRMGVKLRAFEGRGIEREKPQIILCPANLIPVKGHKYLIEAFAILKERGINTVLYLAGQGDVRKEIEKLIKILCLFDRVHFLGQVPHSQLMALYREGKVDIVVLPSIDLGEGIHEGIPVSLIEAMSFGIPVVSTKTGGIPELLTEGAGLLVPPQDSVAIADAIERLVNDNKFRRSLGLNGRKRVEEQFAVVKIMAEMIKFFKVERR